MNRVVIGSLAVLSILAAFAAGCAAIPATETVEDGIIVLHDDETNDEIGSSADEEIGGVRRSSVVRSNVDPTRKNPVDTCAGCGPVPDPWANGPVPDPWNDPSSSSSSSSGGSSTSSGGSTSSSGGNKH